MESFAIQILCSHFPLYHKLTALSEIFDTISMSILFSIDHRVILKEEMFLSLLSLVKLRSRVVISGVN